VQRLILSSPHSQIAQTTIVDIGGSDSDRLWQQWQLRGIENQCILPCWDPLDTDVIFQNVLTFVLIVVAVKTKFDASGVNNRADHHRSDGLFAPGILLSGQSSVHAMWRACLLFSRPFSSSIRPLKEHTAYLAKLATRKPPPVLLESDLEESFIKGTNSPSLRL
jgi:hypothetical protein